jgi:hypothetical protein
MGTDSHVSGGAEAPGNLPPKNRSSTSHPAPEYTRYIPRAMTHKIERSPFRGQRSRSQNRFLVRGGKESQEAACAWRLKTVKAWHKSAKQRGPHVRCSEKDAETSLQSRRFLPPFHRYLDNFGFILSTNMTISLPNS